jgi:hypothetical protein
MARLTDFHRQHPCLFTVKPLEVPDLYNLVRTPLKVHIFSVLAPFPPFQVALGSYQLKVHVRSNDVHVLYFIIYLNIKYD